MPNFKIWKFFVLIFLFSYSDLAAQKTNNVWAFGDKAGLNFNTDPVSVFKSQAEDKEPPYFISSICNKNGNLMFYTDGFNVWNRDNFLLPKYKNLWPWSDTSVMPLICPYPENDSLFYLFGIGKGRNENNLQYLTVRLNKPGDIEEVIYPRPIDETSYFKILSKDASPLLTGTAHCNQKDVWIVTHTKKGLLSFLITDNGINQPAVTSAISPAIIPNIILPGNNSNIKFSANSEKLLVPLINENKIVILDFDNSTGAFSNPIKLSLPARNYLEDVEISPDGSKLYVASFENIEYEPGEPGPDMHYIYQYDLDLVSADEIAASAYLLNGFGDRVACVRTCFYMKRTMQLAPDGKIYLNMRYSDAVKLDLTLSVIEDTNKKTSDARYRKNLVNVGKIYKFINYNYIRSGSFSLRENGIKIKQKTCMDQPVEFALLFSKVDSVKWDFGDSSAGSDNFSTSFTPQYQYPQPGTYTAKAIVYLRCTTDTATKQIIIEPIKSVHVPTFIKDTTMCIGSQLTLDASPSLATAYTWDNGLIYAKRTFDTPGRYAITVYNTCSIERKEFTIKLEPCKCDVFIPNAFTPNNDGLNDVFRPIVHCVAKHYQFRIYNRYGNIVFESNIIGKGWNGRHGSLDAPSGVYIWSLHYRNPNSKDEFLEHGTTMLIR